MSVIGIQSDICLAVDRPELKSAFSFPLATRFLLENESASLPSNNFILQKPFAISGLKNHDSGLRKTLSTISLTSLVDGQYNDIWAGSITLRRTAKPNLANERHLENSLRLSILEARNLPTKRRYYCDICLDRTLYARTTSKTANESGVFWAEDFDLNNLPIVSAMTLSVYREADNGGKDSKRFGTSRLNVRKSRKSTNQSIGFVTVLMSDISNRNDLQAWLTLQPPTEPKSHDRAIVSAFGDAVETENYTTPTTLTGSQTSHGTTNGSNQRHLPQLRVHVRYQSVDVLPLRSYQSFKQLILTESLSLCAWLEDISSVKAKEEAANSLVCLHERNGTLIPFLTSLVVRDVSNLDNDSMAFRSNTMATKSVERYVKFAGSTYLHNLLHRLVQRVLACRITWEVDSEKLTSAALAPGSLTSEDTANFVQFSKLPFATDDAPQGSLIVNQLMLLQHLHSVWRAVLSSLHRFPSALLRVFSSFRTALEPSHGAEFCDTLISACIFLRLICPALLSPSLFGLISAFPSEKACQRNLTLLAKSLLTLANFSAFDDKEPYMRFLNGYVSKQSVSMRQFIRDISTWPPPPGRSNDMDTEQGLSDLVDEGYELANLHSFLIDILENDPKDSVTKLNSKLPDELESLSQLTNDISQLLRQSSTRIPSPNHSSSILNNPNTTNDHSAIYQYHTPNHPGHNSSSSVPYYTLHQNPGFHHPTGNDTFPNSVNILSPLPPTPDDQPFGALHTNSSDYDEPYGSIPTEDSADEEPSSTSRVADCERSLRPAHLSSQDMDQISASSMTSLNRPLPSPFDQRVIKSQLDLRSLPNSLAPSVLSSEAVDDPIYDFVPSSDASSTDDLVQVNSQYLSSSLQRIDFTETYHSDLPQSHPIKVADAKPLLAQTSAYHPDVVKSVQPNQPNLSPRPLPRHLSTVRVNLMPPNNTKTSISLIPISTNLKPVSPVERNGHHFLSDVRNNEQKARPQTLSQNGQARFERPTQLNFPPVSSYANSAPNTVSNEQPASNQSKSSGQSPDVLVDEIVRLRRQLEVTQEDAARTANRLSQQEAELTNLRKLLDQMNTTQKLTVPNKSTGFSHKSPSKEMASKERDRKPWVEQSGGRPTTLNTFDELDDAMARLEREQVELQREQARIRARMTASQSIHQPATTTTHQSGLYFARQSHRPHTRDKPSGSTTSRQHFHQTPSSSGHVSQPSRAAGRRNQVYTRPQPPSAPYLGRRA